MHFLVIKKKEDHQTLSKERQNSEDQFLKKNF